MEIRGSVWQYGDNINTDVIFPGKYTYTLTEPADIAARALEDLDPSFAGQVRPGDVIVAGRNWGCGSSREQAATCLVYSGVGAVIAHSFGRIFYRNAINNGLPAIVCPEAARALRAGQPVRVDLPRHCIVGPEGEYAFPPFSPGILGIIRAGGLVSFVRNQLKGETAEDGS